MKIDSFHSFPCVSSSRHTYYSSAPSVREGRWGKNETHTHARRVISLLLTFACVAIQRERERESAAIDSEIRLLVTGSPLEFLLDLQSLWVLMCSLEKKKRVACNFFRVICLLRVNREHFHPDNRPLAVDTWWVTMCTQQDHMNAKLCHLLIKLSVYRLKSSWV